jgi:hypothetical protein
LAREGIVPKGKDRKSYKHIEDLTSENVTNRLAQRCTATFQSVLWANWGATEYTTLRSLASLGKARKPSIRGWVFRDSRTYPTSWVPGIGVA